MPAGLEGLVKALGAIQGAKTKATDYAKGMARGPETEGVDPRFTDPSVGDLPPAGIVFKGAVTPGMAAAKNSRFNNPFRWIYGDLKDMPKFESTPKSFDALVDPFRQLVGVAESTLPGSMTLHEDLLRAITEYQNQTRQMAKLSGALKMGDKGMDPAALDQFGHVRLLPGDSVYQRKMTLGAPYDYLGHGRNPYAKMPEVSSLEGMRLARREASDLDEIGRILEKLNLYPKDVDVRMDTLWDRYLQ